MRATLALAVLLVAAALPAAPGASAKEGEDLLTDASADVELLVGSADSPTVHKMGDSDVSRNVDLLALALEETNETIRFHLTTASLEGDGFVEHVVRFTFKDASYELVYDLSKGLLSESTFIFACLEKILDENRRNTMWCDLAEADLAAGRLQVEIPKFAVTDQKGRVPIKGDTLEGIQVSSSRVLFFGDGFGVQNRFVDRMPDDDSSASFPITKGEYTTGHLVLASPDPVRMSNGGATTFVFKAIVRNLADQPDEVALEPGELPKGWNVTLRSPIKVDAKAEREVTVLVSVPFAHEHGGFDQFNLTARSMRDASVEARVSLGVYHTPIPQPAGHHPDLFLHARSFDFGPAGLFGRFSFGWMDTLAPGPEDAPLVQPDWSSDAAFRWTIWLGTGLSMGLDFDLDRPGKLVGSIQGNRPGSGTLTAEVRLYDDDGDTSNDVVLATSSEQQLTLDLQGKTAFDLALTPQAAADYIPYQDDQNLYVVLSLATGDVREPVIFGTRPLEPELVVEGWKMTLPLNEYHDKLTGEAEAASLVKLVAQGPTEKAAVPGTTVVYAFQLTATGQESTFEVTLAGNDKDIAEVAPREPFKLAGGASRVITVAVHVPPDANENQEFEVLLYVHDEDNPDKMAIARTKTRTSLGSDAVGDESAAFAAAQEEGGKKTPGLGALALLGLAGLSLGRKRRG